MNNPLAYPIEEAFKVIGVNRSRGFEIIKRNELQTYMEGRRRMATHKACEAFIDKRAREAQSGKARAA